jgi:FtsH-binding integral membrane protein
LLADYSDSSPLASLADVFRSQSPQSFGCKQSMYLSVSSFIQFTHTFTCSTWAFYVPLFGTLINLGVLYWKRHSHPLNLVLLSTFTLMEAFTLGVVVAFFDNSIVLQAL